MKKTLSFASAALVAATLSACADMKITPAGPVPDGRVATADSSLLDAVRWQLANTPSVNSKGVQVAAKDGEITLTGQVADGQTLAALATLVQGVPGVRAVIPNVDVKG
jgi:osmotically-inducible protein OsmY